MIMSGLPRRVLDIDEEKSKIDGWWTWTKSWVTGVEGILYLLLNEKLPQKNYFKNFIYSRGGDFPEVQWKRLGEFDKSLKTNKLKDPNLQTFLTKMGLKKDEMFHCFQQHIKASLYWRDDKIWEGNYFPLDNITLIESISPSGSAVSIMALGMIIAQVTELITSKVGGDNQTNSFWISSTQVVS